MHMMTHYQLIETDPVEAAPDALARRAAELGRLTDLNGLPYQRSLRLLKHEIERQLAAARRA